MRSVRRTAERTLARARRSALRDSGEWHWYSRVPGLRWLAAFLGSLSVRGQLAAAALWLAVLTALSYLPALGHDRLHLSISAANTGLLSTLWQVQATSVGLLLALVVFVFGLLPQGRERLTYREFLDRTWALPLTTANVASMLFTGMVLLGLGHQVPPAGSAPGSGWAVTLASCVSLLSTATIVLILAQTLKAISPEAQDGARRDYQLKAVEQAAHDELIESASVQLMSAPSWPYSFFPSYPVPGRTISVVKLEKGVIRDVSAWRLCILKHLAEKRQHMEPAVRAWPGRTAAAELIAEAWKALAAVRVVPCSDYRPFIRIGRDYEGHVLMNGPAMNRFTALLTERYPDRFQAQHEDFSRWDASMIAFSFVEACVAAMSQSEETGDAPGEAFDETVIELADYLAADDARVCCTRSVSHLMTPDRQELTIAGVTILAYKRFGEARRIRTLIPTAASAFNGEAPTVFAHPKATLVSYAEGPDPSKSRQPPSVPSTGSCSPFACCAARQPPSSTRWPAKPPRSAGAQRALTFSRMTSIPARCAR